MTKYYVKMYIDYCDHDGEFDTKDEALQFINKHVKTERDLQQVTLIEGRKLELEPINLCMGVKLK